MRKLIKLCVCLTFTLLIAIPTARSQDSENNIQFRGYNRIEGILSNNVPTGQYIPQNYFRWHFNPSLYIDGMPISLNMAISTEQDKNRQDINRFLFSINPSLLKNKVPFISQFKKLHFGDTYPHMSSLLLKGTKVRGLDVVYNPGHFYLNVSHGLLRKPLNTAEVAMFKRKITGIQTGIGKPHRSHLFVTALKSQDIFESLPDSITSVKPQENISGAVEGHLSLLKNKLRFETEFATSIFGRNTQSNPLTFDSLKVNFLGFEPTISHSIDYAWKARSLINTKNTRIKLEVIKISPGFTVHGYPSLRKDNFTIAGSWSQYFNKKKIRLNTFAKRQEDNNGTWKKSTTIRYSGGVSINFRLPGQSFLMFGYQPSFQNNEERKQFNDVHNFTAQSGIRYKLGDAASNSTLNLLYQEGKNELDTLHNAIRFVNVGWNQEIDINKNWEISGGVNYAWYENDYTGENLHENNTRLYLGTEVELFSRVNLNLSGHHSMGNTRGQRSGFSVGLDVDLDKAGILALRARQDFYREEEKTHDDFNELIFEASLTTRW